MKTQMGEYVVGAYLKLVLGLTRKTTRDVGNPFFRDLQILGHLRDERAKDLN